VSFVIYRSTDRFSVGCRASAKLCIHFPLVSKKPFQADQPASTPPE
jgi:hypothetical protein